jgi:hypothetical protein
MEKENVSLVDQLAMLRITASSQIPAHEFLFSWNGTPCFARGELVAVTGKAKSGKTYLNSLLMSACAGGDRLGLSRVSEKPLRVVWIDTEQSEDTTCEILRDRIGSMTGNTPDENLYHVFNLRKIKWQDRMSLVLSAIAICQPDLVIFDGIRDVVGDINDYTEAQNTIGQLLHVASDFHPCIVCVLHQNKAVEDKTLRGALGTELQNKSFETYECSKDQDTRIFTIRQAATRKYDMPNKIQFCLDKNGLPVACAVVDEKFGEEAPKSGQHDVAQIFRAAMKGHSEMRAGVLKSQVMLRQGLRSDSIYGGLLISALQQEVLIRRAVSDREVYYQPGPKMYEPVLDFDG